MFVIRISKVNTSVTLIQLTSVQEGDLNRLPLFAVPVIIISQAHMFVNKVYSSVAAVNVGTPEAKVTVPLVLFPAKVMLNGIFTPP